jgi:hypothetical protein
MKTVSIILTLIFSLVLVSSCTHSTRDNTPKPQQAELGGGEYIVIRFPPGKERLLDDEKEKLRVLKESIEGRANVASIEVLAWSDQEYPVEGVAKPSLAEKNLADARGKAVKDYLKKDLGSKKDVDLHNMAKEPGVFAKVFNSDDYRLKNTLEAVSAVSNEMGIVSDNKESKAVVLVKYE